MNRLLRINDSTHRVAFGLGVGVFLGVMPGLGVIAALVFAAIFRLNKVATVLGALITNTWLSVATFLLSIRLGSAIMNLRWQDVYNGWGGVFKHFSWKLLFKASFLDIFLPVILGYFLVSLTCGFIAYLVTFFWLSHLRKKKGL
ncbi:MAG: DUF2062 domain-containing protein [Candidatus Omnitrophica bacterium]|nr:DUF2062 domain-containing protein [Candidatus Omnitrophota bacterium]